MRLRRTLPALLLLGATVAGCNDLNLTNPNQQSTDTFWQNRDQALQGVNAAYNGLLNNGTYGRWLVFATDLRSDIGMVQSPWTDLSNFAKFTFTSYDFEVNREIWQHHYQAIFRANQVVEHVPSIPDGAIDPALRARIVGEAKFIRSLLYYNLTSLYDNVPLIVGVPRPTDRPGNATPEQIYTQIENDLEDARQALPVSYTGTDVGRATKGAATALLGKVHLQQLEFAEAEPLLREVINSGTYSLMPNYADNFTALNENNAESVFEVQFGDRSMLGQGVRGLNIARMVGPCGPSYCDGRPTRWYFDAFQTSKTAANQTDPRMDATLYYPGGPLVYNRTYQDRYGNGTEVFWKKYGEYYLNSTDQDWDAAINFRVIRYADVLLMEAEALNELNRTAEAYQFINLVRRRVSLADLPTGLSKLQMRDAILRERMFEFGLEAQRWNDLRRYNLLSTAIGTCAGVTPLSAVGCDPEFQFFAPGKSERLPIPQSEIDLNPSVRQNPGW